MSPLALPQPAVLAGSLQLSPEAGPSLAEAASRSSLPAARCPAETLLEPRGLPELQEQPVLREQQALREQQVLQEQQAAEPGQLGPSALGD